MEAPLFGLKAHSLFEGVYVQDLDLESIPADIKEILAIIGATATAFSKVFPGRNGIPQHPHDKDGEIYYGSNGGNAVIQQINPGKPGEDIVLIPGGYHIGLLMPGGQHGATGSPFFAVKFKKAKSPPLQYQPSQDAIYDY